LKILEYRKEIDGLRAIAVLPVMLFHAGFSFAQGGFYGVDVFFVISGYLITTMILSQKSNNNFSILRFYERRVRRILPALIIVMLFCIPFAYYLMQPDDLENFGQSLISTSLMSNNILLYLTSGYWDLPSAFKPLLHTWSLGVEEQYYVLFPLLILVTYNRKAEELFFILSALTICSLFFFISIKNYDPDGVFYLLPFRFWEIGMGSCLAIYLFTKRLLPISAFWKEILLMMGMILILFPMVFYHQIPHFFHLLNLMVSIGAILIIIYADPASLIGKILGSKVLVLIGLMSYSLYLWHQPLYAFLRIYSLEEPNVFFLIACFILTFPIAYFSWQFEIFYRRQATLKVLLSFVFFGSLMAASAGLIFISTFGFHNSYPELQSDYYSSFKKSNDPHKEFLIRAGTDLPKKFSNLPTKKLAIMGDSFSSDLINMIKVNNFYKKYELIQPKYNCADPLKIDLNTLMLIKDADLVLITYRILENELQKKCLINKISIIESLDINYIVIGPKDFGFNLNAPLRRKLYAFKALPAIEIVKFNNYIKDLVPEENFIDFLEILGSSEDGRIALFTIDNKLITYDKFHLTYNGALELGQKLFLDPRLVDAVN